MSSELRAALSALPKVELHRHLEGAIRPGTLVDICRDRGVALPTYDVDEITSLLRIDKPAADLSAFLVPFSLIKYSFVDKEAVARITYEVVEDAWQDNIVYVELRFSPEYMSFFYRLGMPQVMDGIVEGLELAQRRFPTTAKLIVSICRDRSCHNMGESWPTPVDVARTAIEYADRGVVGFDLSGIETGFPPDLFIEPFKIAREAGLGITVHAGESSGPENIREAIEHLGATRIGHGVRIEQDPDLVRMAADRGVTLELCPTSNILTHAVNSMEEHPIRRLYDCNVPVTVNTDDPTVCGVTLTGEYALTAERFGFTLREIENLVENARRAAFHS